MPAASPPYSLGSAASAPCSGMAHILHVRIACGHEHRSAKALAAALQASHCRASRTWAPSASCASAPMQPACCPHGTSSAQHYPGRMKSHILPSQHLHCCTTCQSSAATTCWSAACRLTRLPTFCAGKMNMDGARFAKLCVCLWAGPWSCRISGIPTDQQQCSHATSGSQRQMTMSAFCGPASSGGVRKTLSI